MRTFAARETQPGLGLHAAQRGECDGDDSFPRRENGAIVAARYSATSEEEGERRGLPGFELMGDRLNEYRTLRAEVRNSYKHVYGEVEFFKQSWQNALKHNIKVGARSVQPQRAIPAKGKLDANMGR